jgi:hypothetical protein
MVILFVGMMLDFLGFLEKIVWFLVFMFSAFGFVLLVFFPSKEVWWGLCLIAAIAGTNIPLLRFIGIAIDNLRNR